MNSFESYSLDGKSIRRDIMLKTSIEIGVYLINISLSVHPIRDQEHPKCFTIQSIHKKRLKTYPN